MMKKISFVIILLLLFLSGSLVEKVNAVLFKNDSNIIQDVKDVKSQELEGKITFNKFKTVSYNDGIEEENRLTNYTISALSYENQSEVRIVNYTSGTKEKWTGARVSSLATKYEREHPGWLVIGGVNGDFFLINSTCEVKNTSIQEGELYKPSTWNAYGTGVIGWTKDGRIVEGIPTFSDTMFLEILNEKNEVTKEIPLSSINKGIPDTGIGLLTLDKSENLTIDLSGANVALINYTVHRFNEDNNKKYDKLFIKGTCVSNDQNTTAIPEGMVALVAKDDSLDFINIGENIRIQYHLTGDFSEVVNSTGYYAKILTEGKSLFYQASKNNYSSLVHDLEYINCKKNRTVIGKLADGKTILVTIEYDKTGSYGCSYYEAAEYMRTLGCTDAWLLDGGGSTSMVMRNASGGFDLVSGGSDGNERSDGNGILFVIKDPGFTPKISLIERFSCVVDLQKTDSIFYQDVTDVKIKVNNKTYDYNGEKIAITGLEENTTYDLEIFYKMKQENDEVTENVMRRSFTTQPFEYPSLSIDKLTLSATSFTFSILVEGLAKNSIKDIKICLNNNGEIREEALDKTNTIHLLQNLKKNEFYKAHLTYTVIDNETKKEYVTSSSEIEFQTRNTEIPLITKFEILKHAGLNVTFKYEIINYSTIKEAYIDYFGIREEIDVSKNEITLTDIDVTNAKYIFNLILETENETIKSEDIIIERMDELPQEEKSEETTKPKKKCGKKASELLLMLISGMSLFYFIRKKK